MPSSSHPVERFSFSTALFGMLVLTLGMGLGRFLYTPMLPVMMAEGAFSFSQLSWIASGNYAGYLAGSLLFSFGAFHQPSRLRPFLLVSATASGLLILAMAWLPPFILVLLIRFLGGCRQRRYADFWFDADYAAHAPSFCAGSFVFWRWHWHCTGQRICSGRPAFCLLLANVMARRRGAFWHDADCTYAFNALEKHAIAPMPLAKTEQQIMNWWLLAILYGWRDLVISSSRLSCRSWRKMQAHHC